MPRKASTRTVDIVTERPRRSVRSSSFGAPKRTRLAREIGIPLNVALGLDTVSLAFATAAILDGDRRLEAARATPPSTDPPAQVLHRALEFGFHERPSTPQTALAELFGLMLEATVQHRPEGRTGRAEDVA